MVRPRRFADEELLARIVTALEQRTELTPWTLAEVAPAAGISPAGLIKRFGSKAGLLQSLVQRWVQRASKELLDVSDDAGWALAEYVGREFGASSAAGAVYALSEVLSELEDPALASLLAKGWTLQAQRITQLLQAMDLPRLHDPTVGGMLLLDALHGSLFRSAVGLDDTSPLITLERFLEMWK